jgi:hypothetical protein
MQALHKIYVWIITFFEFYYLLFLHLSKGYSRKNVDFEFYINPNDDSKQSKT